MRSVLKHRCNVRRSVSTSVDGIPTQVWSTIATNVPCLLDAGDSQAEPTYTALQQQTADRSGVVFFLPAQDVKPGDRITLSRGATGVFLIKPDPALRSTLAKPSHREFRCEEVPS